jgi:O-antigen/teichoic acid export membrane protein
LCVFAAFAYLARVLTPSEYGIVELALSVTVFFVLGVESGMGLYGARIVAAAPERIPTLIPQIMLLRTLLAMPAFLLILLVAARYQTAGLGILAINGIAVLLTPFLTQWVFQGLRQMQLVAGGGVLRNLVFVGFVLAVIRPGSDIRWVAVAEVTGISALAVANAYFLHQRLGVQLDWHGLLAGTRRLFHDVWYMGMSDFTWACLWYSPALITGWMGLGHAEQVAWIAASVRIVMSLHTFVWLYFFNMLPNLAKEISISVDAWRDLVGRSLATSMWAACLIGVGGTLIAPLALPMIYGPEYAMAVRPFQIVIWMIPITWFSGNFRFSLIAAGQQRWEFVGSSVAASATVGTAFILIGAYGATGAAIALVVGAVVHTIAAIVASSLLIGRAGWFRAIRYVLLATAAALSVGLSIVTVAGVLMATTIGCLTFAAFAIRDKNEIVSSFRTRLGF